MAKNLVVQLARFGDLIQSKRLILSLQREGEAHLALDSSLAPLAERVYPGVTLHPIKAHGGGGAAAALALNSRAFARLRSQKFDTVYNLNRNPMNLALTALFNPETVRGYRLENGQPTASAWTKLAARWTARRRVSPLNLADFWAFFHADPIEPAQVNPIARPRRLPGAGQRIGVALAGREARRSLPPSCLTGILEAVFAARKGPTFVLLGSRAEAAHARLLARSLGQRAAARLEDLSGRTELAELYEIVGDLDLLITPDTGLMHLAAHLGVPVTATFLSSAWAWETGPYGLGHLVWQAVEPCSPCLESAPCPNGAACLEPFRSPHWLAHLAGRNSGAWPDRLLGLVSSLDELGATYLCVDGWGVDGGGVDGGGSDGGSMAGGADRLEREARERLDRRTLLAEYLGLPPPGRRPAWIPATAAEEFLSISDWTLPDYGAR